MGFDPDRHHRRSIRLKGYAYAQAGAYFVTGCTRNRRCRFGDVVDREMKLNEAGRMVERWWLEVDRKFPNAKTDVYMVMPNHFHGILVLIDTNGDTPGNPANQYGATHDSATHDGGARHRGAHAGAPLSTIVQWFKTMTTNEYIRGVKTLGWPPFAGTLWQRNYHEHIIRNEESLVRIRQYILDNPARWTFNRKNASAASPKPAPMPKTP